MTLKRICGDCRFHLDRDLCPRAIYRTHKKNLVACMSTDGACELFQPKHKAKPGEEPDMGYALKLLRKHLYKCPTDTRELLFYEKGVYDPAESLVHEILEREYGKEVKKNFISEAMGHLERSNYIKRKEVNRFVNKLPIENGIFHFVTHDVKAFDPEEVFTYKLNVGYNPEAKCPNFLKFVNQIIRKDDIPLLQEIMGYCLLPGMPFHKIFWFYGPGRNGKDRIILTLEHILGENSCSHLNLGELRESRRFSVAQLYGKLLNVSSEPDTKYPIQTNILKTLSGENTIHAELKMKNTRLRFRNVAKLIVVGNKFPKIEDSSIAFWDRVEVLNFPFSFTKKQAIQNIERQWLDKPGEKAGIFNWMLKGLYRLQENRVFSTSRTTKETKAEFMRVSDPFSAWLNDCCKILPSGQVLNDELYSSYKDYCDALGAPPEKPLAFYNKLRATPKIRPYRTTKMGKTFRGFLGISLLSPEEKDADKSQTRISE